MPGFPTIARFLPVLFMLIFVSFWSAALQPAHGSTSDIDFRSAVERETFALINGYRKSRELPSLAWDDKIAKAARAHSRDMATGEVDFGHDGFRERVSGLKSVMAGFRGAGENVFMSSDLNEVAHQAVEVWLHSPHHLENIRGDFNYSGMGVWQDKDGTIYFTQIFMKFAPRVEQAQAAEAPGVGTSFGILASPYTRGGE